LKSWKENNLHKKVKETAGMYKSNTMGRLHDENDKIIVDKEEKMTTWRNYIEQLYEGISRLERVPDFDQMENLPIMIEEVKRAMAQIKKDKSPGPDNIYGEFLKLIDEEGVSWLTNLFNRIYASGVIPQIWLKTAFVTLPKKPSAKCCDDFRTISLMRHLLKLFLKITH